MGLARCLRPLSAVTASPQFHPDALRVVLGIAPFSGILGFVTPMLVDRWSAGDPSKAGSAYAVNVMGCILGPLLSGFVLLPLIGERWALLRFRAALARNRDGYTMVVVSRRGADDLHGRQWFPIPSWRWRWYW